MKSSVPMTIKDPSSDCGEHRGPVNPSMPLGGLLYSVLSKFLPVTVLPAPQVVGACGADNEDDAMMGRYDQRMAGRGYNRHG